MSDFADKLIKPPGVDITRKTRGAADTEKEAVTTQKLSSVDNNVKHNRDYVGGGTIGRIHSVKGIPRTMGMNYSIDVNTDKIELSATGISYRKLKEGEKNLLFNNSEAIIPKDRRTSAKVTSNPTNNLINSA